MRTTLFVCAVLGVGGVCLAADVRTITTMTNDIIYDAGTGSIFATAPSGAAGGTGNTIKTINPVSSAVSQGVFVGSEPTTLARSHDGHYLYVALSGAAAVRRYDIHTATAGLQFPLGNDSFLGPMYAEDIAVMPGAAGTVAVSLFFKSVSPRHAGVAVFDDGVARPTWTPDHTGSNRVEWSDSPATLYGYNNETTEFGFRTMSVTSGGISTTKTTGNLFSGFGVDFVCAGGKAFSTTGRIIDPVSHTSLGSFSASGPLAVDPANRRAFFLTNVSGSSYAIKAFNTDTFVPVDTLLLGSISGTPSDLIRWGDGGLAFRTSDKVYLIDNWSAVPEPATLALLALGSLLIARRRQA